MRGSGGTLQAEETAGAKSWTSEPLVFGEPQRTLCVWLPGGRHGLGHGQPRNQAEGPGFYLSWCIPGDLETGIAGRSFVG